jgi:hypothetical protein
VINVAGTRGDKQDIAPGGADYVAAPTHNLETIMAATHPYFTGEGFGGLPLSASNFTGWQPADIGQLTSTASDTVLLRNSDGISMIEYAYGDGKVILTSLNFCGPNVSGRDRRALENLLRYGRFYEGAAFTPAATLTPTPTMTATPIPPTGTVTNTPTITRTPTEVPTGTATPIILRGDLNDDGVVDPVDLSLLLALLFERSGERVNGSGIPPAADVNADDYLTSADVTALLELLGT